MIAFIMCNSKFVPLLEGLLSSNPCRFVLIFRGFAEIVPTTSGLTIPRSDQLSYFYIVSHLHSRRIFYTKGRERDFTTFGPLRTKCRKILDLFRTHLWGGEFKVCPQDEQNYARRISAYFCWGSSDGAALFDWIRPFSQSCAEHRVFKSTGVGSLLSVRTESRGTLTARLGKCTWAPIAGRRDYASPLMCIQPVSSTWAVRA